MSIIPNLYKINETDLWKKNLDEEGYAVISDILSENEYKEAFELFKKDWSYVSPNFNFEDKNTWGIENSPMMYGKGMAVFNGFGQSDFMWYLRLSQNIKNIFQEIHNTEDLVTSLDGFSVYFSNKQKSKPWLHIDENPNNPIYCVQGSYNFFKVSDEDAGFVVVPRSHIEYTPVVTHNKDWLMCPENEHLQNCKKLLIPKNCFTIWNSRLIHANQGMTKKNTEINRLTTYISYLPKNMRSEEILNKRIKAYKDSETTSHWSNRCELKKYPFGFGKRYEERGYRRIVPKLNNDGIPEERLKYL